MSNTIIPSITGDTELVRYLKGGEADRKKGEELLFSTYRYFIKEGERKYGLLNEEVFDGYSDAVLAVIEKIRNDSFKGYSSIKTFLYQVFQNKCVDLLRKRTTNKQSVHRTTTLSESFSELSDPAKSIIQKLAEKTDFDLLKRRLSEIGDSCSKILLLWADGFSDKEVMASLSYKTADVVKTTRLRCMEKLRRLYNTTL